MKSTTITSLIYSILILLVNAPHSYGQFISYSKSSNTDLEKNSGSLCAPNYNTCPALIHVLILVEPLAKDWLIANNTGNSDALAEHPKIKAATSAIQRAFALSDIPNKNFRFTIQDTDFDLNDGNNIFMDLNTLRTESQTLKTELKADLVAMLAYKDYDGSFGYSLNCTDGPSPDCAYAIARVDNIGSPYYTFAHEIGHLFGAGHEGFSSGYFDCPYANSFSDTSGEEYFTLMHTRGTEGAPIPGRIRLFSNPDIKFNQVPTGSLDKNNALAIRNTACDVANYENSIEMTASISGPKRLCKNTYATFTASVNAAGNGIPGQGPFVYNWRISDSPLFDPRPFLETIDMGSSFYINAPHCPASYIQLVVTSADGVRISRIHKISTSHCSECTKKINSNSLVQAINIDNVINIFPNPASADAILSFQTVNNCEVRYFIQDISGRIILESERLNFDEGQQLIKLPLSGYNPGIYFCNVIVNGEKTSKKIVLNR